MAKTTKQLKENGKVLSKYYKKASDEFVSVDGKIVGAQPEKWMVKVISSEDFDTINGYQNDTILEYPVTQDVFHKLTFCQNVRVCYEFSLFGGKFTTKAINLELVEAEQTAIKIAKA